MAIPMTGPLLTFAILAGPSGYAPRAADRDGLRRRSSGWVRVAAANPPPLIAGLTDDVMRANARTIGGEDRGGNPAAPIPSADRTELARLAMRFSPRIAEILEFGALDGDFAVDGIDLAIQIGNRGACSEV